MYDEKELMNKVYREEYYSSNPSIGWKKGYNEKMLGKPHTLLHQMIHKFFKGKPSILVLGCALGLAVKRSLQCGHFSVGIDWTPALGRHKLVKNLSRGSVTHLPFRDHSFDLGLNVNLMEHIPEKYATRVLLEQGRVCKEHLFSIPCMTDFKQLGSFYRESGHLTFKTADEWLKLLSILGRVEHYHEKNPYGWRFFIVRRG